LRPRCHHHRFLVSTHVNTPDTRRCPIDGARRN
jgi:hypothetical protein